MDNYWKRVVILFTVLIILFFVETIEVFADEQPAPTGLTVEMVDGKPAIGYTPEKRHYVVLKWNPPVWGGHVQYYNLFYCEDGKAYQKYPEKIDGTVSRFELTQLSPGKVYHAYLVAVHEHIPGGGSPVTIDASKESNEVIFMTDMEILTLPVDYKTIELQWTDIYYKGSRINYEIYISESSNFSLTPAIQVSPSNIKTSGPVKPVNGKLVYDVADLKSGTVYYFKIKPIVGDPLVFHNNESEIVAGFTHIVVRISKISSNWWRLEWDPITDTNLGTNEGIVYRIKRSVDRDLERDISAVKDLHVFVKSVGTDTYYRIQADVITQIGKMVSIISPEIYAREGEVPTVPAVPEIVEQLGNQKMEITPTTLRILWRLPVSVVGDIYGDISYDIWLLTNPYELYDTTIPPLVKDLKVGPANYVYKTLGSVKTSEVIGYQYTVTNLTPNTVYYLKMIAKKTYPVYENNILVNKTFSSEPGLKVVKTLPEGSIDRPITPAKPPLKVKKSVIDGNLIEAVTSTSVTLEWKNRWYEVWNDVYNKWEYVPEEELEMYAIQGYVYRLVAYDNNVKFSVGYEVYTDNFDFTKLTEKLRPVIMQFNEIPNSLNSDTIEFTITPLTPNTTYVIWLRAYISDSLKSELSDPIIVTTKSNYKTPLGKPSVPVFNYKFEGDTYAEIGWNIRQNYYYNIKYSTVENLALATNNIKVSPEQLKFKTRYRIEGLTPNTVYYFWISAEVKDDDGRFLTSEWSDAYIVKTLPYAPPEVPTGFGLKNIANPIGKDYIYFEWVSVPGLEYILQISKKDNFSDAVSYEVKSVGEYKIEKLESNTRYFARLYAYDPKKGLKSNYTSTVAVKTLKSFDEYYTDADIDVEEIIRTIMPEINQDGSVGIDLTDKKADLFLNEIYREDFPDYIIDFTYLGTDVKKIHIKISPKIFTTLFELKKSLIVNNGKAGLVIKPEFIDNTSLKRLYKENPSGVLEVILEKPVDIPNRPSGAEFVSDVWKISLAFNNKGVIIPITEVNNEVRIRVPYSKSNWYDSSIMSGYIYNESLGIWEKVKTNSWFDNLESRGLVDCEIPKTGNFAIIKSVNVRFSDISGHPAESDIKAIINKYNMKSLGSGLFNPDKNITKGDAIKVLLDVLGYNYNEDYIEVAEKAGITSYIDIEKPDNYLTREEASGMITRIYEIITGEKGVSNISLASFRDVSAVNENLLPRVRFAVEKGILKKYSSDMLMPKTAITRAEMMGMLKRMLEVAGN